VQHQFSGPGAHGLIQKLTPASLISLKNYQSTLSTFLHPHTGGIVDDTIITKVTTGHRSEEGATAVESYYVVTNGACREKDIAYLQENIDVWHAEGGEKVDWNVMEGWGLIALQGPMSAEILDKYLAGNAGGPLHPLYFGRSTYRSLSKQSPPFLISRSGYTGEDGFEISLHPDIALEVLEGLLKAGGPDKVRLAGLGARDSLRLEAGMCLYGHDLDDTTTPVEAALSWIVGADRRIEGGFHGSEVVLKQLKPLKDGGGVSRRRVGFVVEGAPAREGAEIIDTEGNAIGKITSGCPSPSLGKNIAMGYIKNGLHKAGTEVNVLIRGKPRKATVTKMPFVPARYVKAP
jgi:aminomethyltransferase